MGSEILKWLMQCIGVGVSIAIVFLSALIVFWIAYGVFAGVMMMYFSIERWFKYGRKR